jgi:hypothetical protein
MLYKNIEFSTHEDYFSLKEDFPIPAILNIPSWYKNLTHNFANKTVKGCMPFLDSLIAGYILKIPQDFAVYHNVDNKNEKLEVFKDSFHSFGLGNLTEHINARFINLNSGKDVHSVQQLKGSPILEKNKNLPIYKIINPWRIKTPKGYSCLFVPPLNNTDDRFSIIPAIVDTDTFVNEINFPIVINGDKYPILETVIEKGTPYVQVIPFKRDNWKMSTKPVTKKEIEKNRIFYFLKLINIYKNKFWQKKSWK